MTAPDKTLAERVAKAEQAALDMHTQLRAAEAHADRLAEALRDARNAYPQHCAHTVIDEALDAHHARRKEEGR